MGIFDRDCIVRAVGEPAPRPRRSVFCQKVTVYRNSPRIVSCTHVNQTHGHDRSNRLITHDYRPACTNERIEAVDVHWHDQG